MSAKIVVVLVALVKTGQKLEKNGTGENKCVKTCIKISLMLKKDN
jgi:hypothetical protein